MKPVAPVIKIFVLVLVFVFVFVIFPFQTLLTLDQVP